MKFVALLSGGKDSLYAAGKAIQMGHEMVCVANLYSQDEQDSYMFQCAGTLFVPAIAKALNKPLISRKLTGKSVMKEAAYTKTEGDEIEDLYELILEAKCRFPDIEAVVSGAVLSEYQRARVEHICARLSLASIAPIWRMDQRELLLEMIEEGYEAVLIKISSMGLYKENLGQSIRELFPYLEEINKKYQVNMAGEGGEYESLVLDAPIMKMRLVLERTEVITDSKNEYSPYGHLIIHELSLVDKETGNKEAFHITQPVHPRLYRSIQDFYTAELTVQSFGHSAGHIQHEAYIILNGLKQLLEAESLSLTQIYYVIVYIQDMNNFAVFNSVYSRFFNFPNPPSRVLCEYSSQPEAVKIVVKGTKDAKKCTWVQSISPWAVANIGPYSQAYKVNACLHMAGVISLVPTSMQIAEDQISQVFKNCEAVAKVNYFKIEESETLVVYYTGDKPDIDKNLRPFYVKPTGIPRGCAIELEFHLHKDVPACVTTDVVIEGEGFKANLTRRDISDFVYLTWHLIIENDENTLGLITCLRQHLEDYYVTVKSKSPVKAEQLLGGEDILVQLEDYIIDLRVFSPRPDRYKQSFLQLVPASFSHTENSGILIHARDSLQLATYHFINNS